MCGQKSKDFWENNSAVSFHVLFWQATLVLLFRSMNSNGLIFIGRLLSSPSNTPQVCQNLGSIGAWWFQTEPSKRKCHFQQKWCPFLETLQLDRLIVINRSSRCCFCISLGHWVGKRGGGQVQGSKTKISPTPATKKHTFEKGVFESGKIDELNSIESSRARIANPCILIVAT